MNGDPRPASRSLSAPPKARDSRNTQSDGTLKALYPPTPAEWAKLRKTKIEVLEIVWCYLYSGRAEEAQGALAEMWPASDLERIRAAILAAQAKGIRNQVDGISTETVPRWRKKHALVFDERSESVPVSNELQASLTPGLTGPSAPDRTFQADASPIPILLRRPPLPSGKEDAVPTSIPVDLLIDEAGKVRSAKAVGQPDRDLLQATAGWKFIPAFHDGHAVASRIREEVTPTQ